MDKKLQKGRERLADLSQRERDVLKLIALGLANDEIATKLFISPHTVKNHVSNIYRKLGIDDRTQVALVALRLGIVSLDHLDKA
ncbi:MAG: helix-turn-helix domain-containing protein [Limnochordia bacterium]|jgi:two-component system response regulator DegU